MAQELKIALPIPAEAATAVAPTSDGSAAPPAAASDVKEPITLQQYLAPAPLFGAPDPKDGWTVVMEKKVDPAAKDVEGAELLSIWRRPAPGTDPKLGLVQWRSVGTCPIPAETYFNVQWDVDYHKVWDEYCIKLAKHAVQGSSELIYWKAKFPFPMDDRDYVLNRRAVVDRITPQGPYWYALSQTTKSPQLPPIKGTVRVDTYSSHFVIRPLPLPNGAQSTRSCQFAVLAIDDPKMIIPQIVINWAVEKALPGMMKKFRQAASKYDAWKAAAAAKKGAPAPPLQQSVTATTTAGAGTIVATPPAIATTTVSATSSTIEVDSAGDGTITASATETTITQVESANGTCVTIESESVTVLMVEPTQGK